MYDTYATKNPTSGEPVNPYCAVPIGTPENLPSHPNGHDWMLIRREGRNPQIAAAVKKDGHYIDRVDVTVTEHEGRDKQPPE